MLALNGNCSDDAICDDGGITEKDEPIHKDLKDALDLCRSSPQICLPEGDAESFDRPDAVGSCEKSKEAKNTLCTPKCEVVRRGSENWLDKVIRDDECIHEEDEQLTKIVQEEINDEELTQIIRSSSLSKQRALSGFTEQELVEHGVTPDEANKQTEDPFNDPVDIDPHLTMQQIETEYSDIVKYRIFQLAGDDLEGRPVIVFSMSHLPSRNDIDHARLFSFMEIFLNQYVENDYTIVYFHHGLNSKNKPPLKMLLGIYDALDRKYKKNLKVLLLVHPTKFIKTVMKVFYPLISKKFGKKIKHINRLEQLKTYVRLDQLDIPKNIFKYDKEVCVASGQKNTLCKTHDIKTKQFGVPLKHLMKKSGNIIPIVIQSTVDFITTSALEVEGIFRRSAQSSLIQEAVNAFNYGVNYEFSEQHVYLAPTLLKRFLRDLPEPLLTFGLYGKLTDCIALADKERLAYVKKILNDDLPVENRFILMFLLQFLQHVIAHSLMNRMDSGSLSIVLGPNLLWEKGEASSLTSTSKVNLFTKFLIDNSNLIFEMVENTKTKQFGVPLRVLKQISGQDIPVPVQVIVDYITNNAIDVDGIFRRTAQSSIIDEAVDLFDSGMPVDFSQYDIHLAPALLKRFLRDLPEPLLTFDLYVKVIESCDLAEEERNASTGKILNNDLPEENRVILIFLLKFFKLVVSHSSSNLMNCSSLAFNIGQNLLWSGSGASSTVEDADKINSFTEYLLDNVDHIFSESSITS